MSASFQDKIVGALKTVRNKRTGYDVVDSEMVRDIATTTDGKIRLTLLMTADDDAELVRDVRKALEKVDGATDVRVDVKPAPADPESAAAQQGVPKPPTRQSRALPVMGQDGPTKKNVPPPQTPVSYPNLGHIVAISSGKGGVGKSTVSANLAIALAKQGARVGLMDGDIYGPNIPRMMGVSESPPVRNEKIVPLEAHGVKLISLGLLIDRDQPAIWRGPIIMKIVNQFLRDVDWGQLDFFIVDLPPGTGDAQLSLVQATLVKGAVIVTTPQEVATGDALRGAKMFERVNVPVLGIVENMSYLICPHCEERTNLFGEGGGKRLADELKVPLLGEIPLYQPVMSGGDTGAPIVVAEPDSPAGKALIDVAGRLAGILSAADSSAPKSAQS
jgi:ATP-binding protein involved in chromosome partitioning